MSGTLNTRLFGAVERRLFRATAVLAAIVALLALIVGVTWVLGQALSHFYNLIMPLCVAGILALVLYPVVDFIERRGGMPRIAAISIIMLVFAASIVGAVLLVVPTLLRQIVEFTDVAPKLISGWLDYMSLNFPGISQMVKDSAEDGQIKEMLPDMEGAGETIGAYAGALAGLSLVPLLLFLALLSGGRLRDQTKKALTVFGPRIQKSIMYFLDVFLAQLTGFFQGQLVIAVIMGILFSIGFTLIGLTGGILIGLILGLLNIVPFLGTLIGLLIVLPLSYFQPSGGFQLLGLAMLVFAVVQLLESWVLTPKIMSNRSGLHPALVVIAVFFWGIALGGITGMVLAVPLTAFLVAVWHQAKASLSLAMTADQGPDRIEIQAGTTRPSTKDDAAHPPERGKSAMLRSPPRKRTMTMKIMRNLRKLFGFPSTRLSSTEKVDYNHAENDFTSEGGPLPEQAPQPVKAGGAAGPLNKGKT